MQKNKTLTIIILTILDYSISIKASSKKLHRNNFSLEKIEQPKEQYFYKSFHLPSPFVPPFLEKNYKKREKTNLNNLTNTSVYNFNLIGVWNTKKNNRKALILSPSGESFIIERNMKIGDQGGFVSKINSNSIVIRSYSNLPDGTRSIKEQLLYIRDEK